MWIFAMIAISYKNFKFFLQLLQMTMAENFRKLVQACYKLFYWNNFIAQKIYEDPHVLLPRKLTQTSIDNTTTIVVLKSVVFHLEKNNDKKYFISSILE